MTPSGQITTLGSLVLHGNVGTFLYPNLVQSTDGNLYGSRLEGGSADSGTVYRVTTGLPPFVKLLPAAATAGSTITIFGSNAAGASG